MANQLVVPVATPEVPKFVAHEIELTATLSLAVPRIVTEDAVVENVVAEG